MPLILCSAKYLPNIKGRTSQEKKKKKQAFQKLLVAHTNQVAFN